MNESDPRSNLHYLGSSEKKRNTSINGIGGLVFHYQVIGQNEHRNIEVPGREIDNGINNNEKGKKKPSQMRGCSSRLFG